MSPEGAIFDRCPLDFAAYLSSEIPRRLDVRFSERAESYVNHCIEISKTLGLIVMTDPIPTIATLDRGDMKGDVGNVAYSLLIHRLIIGLLNAGEIPYLQVMSAPVNSRLANILGWLASEGAAGLVAIAMKRRAEQCPNQHQ